ncbi:hypothetical protein DINM_007107 [Dirofilaria immitis]|nr:hypothetical protein [Dirofilaria immitis]
MSMRILELASHQGNLLVYKISFAKRFESDVCDAEFTTQQSEKTLSNTYSQETFKCDACGKRFSSASKLKRHNQTDVDKKPFKCDLCDKGFSDFSKLKRHNRTYRGSFQLSVICLTISRFHTNAIETIFAKLDAEKEILIDVQPRYVFIKSEQKFE